MNPGDPAPTFSGIQRLAAVTGVRLAVAASGDEGLVLHTEGANRASAPAAAALGAAMLGRGRSVAAACGHGEPKLLRLQCGEGQMLVAAAGSTVLIVLAERGANAGRIRLELLRVAEALA